MADRIYFILDLILDTGISASTHSCLCGHSLVEVKPVTSGWLKTCWQRCDLRK